MQRATTASGARFSDGVSTFWNKGDEASFMSAERQYSSCRNNRAQALSDGVQRLSVVLEGRPCNDSMSGESFEASVELGFDGKALMGCGGALH